MPNELRNWIVFDLDGTLTDFSHRVHLAQAGQFEEFNAACRDDKIRPETLAAFLSFTQSRFSTMILSGRDRKYQKLTLELLGEHGIAPDILLMRDSKDFRSDHEVKIGLLEGFFGSKAAVLNAVLLCLDDREKVVEALRDYGLVVWQVRQGDY